MTQDVVMMAIIGCHLESGVWQRECAHGNISPGWSYLISNSIQGNCFDFVKLQKMPQVDSAQLLSAYNRTMMATIAILNAHLQNFTTARVAPSSEELHTLSSNLLDLITYHPTIGCIVKREQARQAQIISRKRSRQGIPIYSVYKGHLTENQHPAIWR